MYILKYISGHIYVEINGFDWLVDTGSPISFGSIDRLMIKNKVFTIQASLLSLDAITLSKYVKHEVVGLIGTDILNQFYIIFDIQNDQITFSIDPLGLEGEILDINEIMGIPSIVVTVDNNEGYMFFDSGAQISYMQKNIITQSEPTGVVKDFYPGVGQFETETAAISLKLGNLKYTLQCGYLPEMLNMTLMVTNTVGIIGNETMRDKRVGYFPKEKKLIFENNLENSSTLFDINSLEAFCLLLAKERSMKKILEHLIEIGITYSNKSLNDVLKTVSKRNIHSNQQYAIYQFFMRGPNSYNAMQLSNILRGVIVYEIALSGGNPFGYGSVSATIAVAFALSAVDIDIAQKMLQWSDNFGFENYYFPLGSASGNGRAYYNYILRHSNNEHSILYAKEALAESNARRDYIDQEEAKRHIEAKDKKEHINNLVRQDVKDRKNGKRVTLIEKLNLLSIIEKLQLMSKDTKHSVKYYPTNIAYDTTIETLIKLSDEEVKKLIKMCPLQMKGTSPWKQFKKQLDIRWKKNV